MLSTNCFFFSRILASPFITDIYSTVQNKVAPNIHTQSWRTLFALNIFFNCYSTWPGGPLWLGSKTYCALMSFGPSDPIAPVGRSVQAGRGLFSLVCVHLISRPQSNVPCWAVGKDCTVYALSSKSVHTAMQIRNKCFIELCLLLIEMFNRHHVEVQLVRMSTCHTNK